MKKRNIVFFAIGYICTLHAQEHSHSGAKPMVYPNIDGYVTLKTDLHIHTVFSDGNVWPTIRVMEALREGLDAISLTEHLEYQPYEADIPHPDRNRAHQLAVEEAKGHNLLIVPGSEITRSAPVGHNNAIFITDANKLIADNPFQPFAEAKKQKAFVFWNHPAWYAQSPTGNPVLSDFQEARIKNKELHGIEVINSVDYAEESLALALKHNLTIMGTSDVHGLVAWDYTEKGGHRPITLVFAKDKSIESLREALFAGRTVAVYNDLFVGRPEYLIPLLKGCMSVENASYIEDTSVLKLQIKNTSSSDLLFENTMPYTLYSKAPVFGIKAGESAILEIKTLEKLGQIDLRLKALGAYTAPKEHPIISWTVKVD